MHESFTMTSFAADAQTNMPAQPALDPAISLADFAASTASDPQPVGRCLTIARERAFTGEMVFHLGRDADVVVRTYFDAGLAYYVERDGDAPLSDRLLAMGVLDHDQLQRGVVRVGDIEHLGRLFDRDETVERDAVVVAVETITDAMIGEIVTYPAQLQINEFRHHQSGIHRWFVAPRATGAAARPVAEVAQVDRSVTEELPRLTGPAGDDAAPSTTAERVPSLQIEWDVRVPGEGDPLTTTDAAGATEADADQGRRLADIDIEAELGRFDADRADWSAGLAAPTADVVERSDAPPAFGDAAGEPAPARDEASTDDTIDDFRIVWPDGTEETAAATAAVDDAEAPDATHTPSSPGSEQPHHTALTHEATSAALASPPADRGPTDDTEPPSTHVPIGGAVRLDALPAPDADVPDDVADAVRRALAAIEQATEASPLSSPHRLPKLTISPAEVPDVRPSQLEEVAERHTTDEPTSRIMPIERTSIDELLGTPSTQVPAPTASPEPTVAEPNVAEPTSDVDPTASARSQTSSMGGAPTAPAAGAFAPPTPDMSAEAIYARAAEQVESVPGPSAVPPADDDERTSALRRLIGSLRRKP